MRGRRKRYDPLTERLIWYGDDPLTGVLALLVGLSFLALVVVVIVVTAGGGK